MTTTTTDSTTRPASRTRLVAVAAATALLASIAAFVATGDEPDAERVDGSEPISVGLADYGFTDLPATVPAGTRITIDNQSGTELHEFVAVLLPEDERRSAEELVQLPPDQLAGLFAGVRTVLLQAPGSDEVIPAVGDGTLDEPGRYLVICAIPTGADPAAYLEAAAASEGGPPDVPGGPPHLAQGMWAELTVEG